MAARDKLGMDDLKLRFVRGVVLLGLVFLLFFSGEFLLEWWRLGKPSGISWAGVNDAKLVDSLSPVARAYNNILAMLIATVGLAIPLTANIYTPKLIDLFLKDRINRVVLVVMAFGAAHVLWAMYLVGPGFAPMWAYRLAVYGALLGWVILIPYFFYIVKFLDPSFVITRLSQETLAEIENAGRMGEEEHERIDRSQDEIHERLFQIGALIIKSIDRADRSVTREGVFALEQIATRYGELKTGLPAPWFAVDRHDFVGLSGAAIKMLKRKRTWLEMQVIRQLYIAYQNALDHAPDAVSTIANVNRVIATAAAARGDKHVVSLCVRFFNSFLREGIKRKDTRAVYDIFYQYRQLAGDLRDNHDVVRNIGGFFVTYSALAAETGSEFVPQLAGFDLAQVMEVAYEAQNPRASELLDDLLGMSHFSGGKPETSRLKAKLIAAGYFHEKGMHDEVKRVKASLENVPRDALLAAVQDLVGVDKKAFWEVTDRQVNIEWTPKSRRRSIRALADELCGVE